MVFTQRPLPLFFAKSAAFFWFYKKLCYNQIIVKKNDCKNIFYGFGNVYFFKALLILSLNSQVKSLLENWEKKLLNADFSVWLEI